MQQQVCEVRPKTPRSLGPARLGGWRTVSEGREPCCVLLKCQRPPFAAPRVWPTRSLAPSRGGLGGAGAAERRRGWAEPRRREGPLTGAGLPGGRWVTWRGVSRCRASPERSAGAPGIPRATGTPFALWQRRFRAGSQRSRRCGMSCPQQHRRSREPAEGGRCPAGSGETTDGEIAKGFGLGEGLLF